MCHPELRFIRLRQVDRALISNIASQYLLLLAVTSTVVLASGLAYSAATHEARAPSDDSAPLTLTLTLTLSTRQPGASAERLPAE